MSNETQKSSGSGANTLIGIVVGAILMAGGTYMAVNHQPHGLYDLTHSLEEQGIPLDLGKTVAVIGVFLILFPVIKSFFLAPLGEAIQTRTTDLERTFTEAEDLRSEMGQMRADYEKRLVDTEAAAREQIRSEIAKAQEFRAQLEADARARADEYLKKATEEIDMEKNRVMTDLRIHVVDLTLGATEKILGESVDNERNRRLVQEFVDKIEVPT
jgi:F-type H+-transporting ATPase subunit b